MQAVEWRGSPQRNRIRPQLISSAFAAVIFLFSCYSQLTAEIVWPIQGQSIPRNRPVSDVIQATSSGKPESGLFGCVRNNGYKFHEGIDIKSQRRDRYNRPMDKVVAVLPGRVAYVNKIGGKSSYGIYVILEHLEQRPQVYSLYAHLNSVEAGILKGKEVKSGQVLGLMGNTASTGIPRSRAHLHFEIGLRLTDNFQNWYSSQKFKTRNEHGVWNGMNMVGLDVLDLFRKAADGKISNIEDYFKTIPEAFRLRVRSSGTPDMMRRYPGLVEGVLPRKVTAWDIAFSWYGLPIRVFPVSDAEAFGKVQILKMNKTLLAMTKCRSTLVITSNGVSLGSILKHYLELIFEV